MAKGALTEGGRGGKKGKARGRGKARQPETTEEEQALPEVQDQQSRDRSEEEEEVLEMPDGSDQEEEEDGVLQDDGEAWDRERQAAEEKIADFYEARPYFFDKSHDLYKNKKKQRSELVKLSHELGGIYNPDYIDTRKRSNRTDYVKLLERVKNTKSGSGTAGLTAVQKWKLRRWSFVGPYVRKRKQSKSAELGQVHRSTAGSVSTQRADEEEEEGDGDDLAEPSTSTNTAIRSIQPAKKAKKSPGDLASVLTEYLAQSRKEQEAVNAQLREMVQPVAENTRTSWANWLSSVCMEVPSETYRQFQSESFQLAMRFLPSRPVPAPSFDVPPPQSRRHHQQQEENSSSGTGSYLSMLTSGPGLNPPGQQQQALPQMQQAPHLQYDQQQQQTHQPIITLGQPIDAMRPLSAPGDILSFAYTTTVGTSSSNSSSRPPSAALGAPPVPPSGRWSTESNLNISGLSQLNASQTSNQSISSILRQANQDMDYVGIAQDCSGSNTPTAQDKQ